MDCSRLRECLSLYPTKDLDDTTARDVQIHLSRCRSCQNQAEALRWQASLLRTYGRSLPAREAAPDVWGRLAERLAAPLGAPSARRVP